ncbi:MAG: threonine synthase [Pseudomonadales bacterium]
MRYISTRGRTEPMPFKDAVITGMAPDGGLLIPEALPDLRGRLNEFRGQPFVGFAQKLIALFADDIPVVTLDALIERAYATFDHPEVVPFRALKGLAGNHDVQVMELFHGPTLAFKDVALQFLGQLFEYILEERGEHLNILGATSGDTGSAAIAGVRGLPAVDVFIMFPEGRVSPLQERQMTTIPDTNVHCLAVEGSFDDCQSLMKTLFADADTKQTLSLGAVNSVNWARVLAQIVYYGYASLKFARPDPVTFCVPTGNFGNVFAGYLAKRMGFPIDKLVIATNDNDILARFFETGEYRRGTVHHTSSPAMDIQVASNFERYLYYYFDEDPERLRAFMTEFADTGAASVGGRPETDEFLATAVDEATVSRTIRDVYEHNGYVVDPHTAVGLAAAERFRVPGVQICAATAHPAKFPESVNAAIGKDVAHHPTLDALKDLPTRKTRVPATTEAVRAFLDQHAR